MADASFLARLSVAVEQDVRRPEAWRKDVLKLLQQLTTKLMTAPDSGSKTKK
jgi:hypothetical protein